MGVNEEILKAMASGESVDDLHPVGTNGKILKAKAKGESVDEYKPIGTFGELLKEGAGGGSVSLEDILYAFFDVDKATYPFVTICEWMSRRGYVISFSRTIPDLSVNGVSYSWENATMNSVNYNMNENNATQFVGNAVRAIYGKLSSGNSNNVYHSFPLGTNYGNPYNFSTFYDLKTSFGK